MMSRAALSCSLAIVASTLIGCTSANWNSINREFLATPNKVASIDAKQRVVSIRSIPGKNAGQQRLSVCTEQSPDVFSFLSSSFGVSAETQKIAASIASAVAESGGSLAFRTQVTQAQTNFLYTLCEMYASEAISDTAVRTELRRFQQTLLGILAIEQLTSPNRASLTQQIITTSAATVGKDVEAAQKSVDDTTKEVATAETDLKDAQAAVDKSKPAKEGDAESDAYKAAVKDRDAKNVALSTAQKKLESAQNQLTAARMALSVSANGAQPSTINVYAPSSSQSDKTAEQVVRALDIVLQRGVVIDYCAELLFEGRTIPLIAAPICTKAINTYIDVYKTSQDTYNQASLNESQFRSTALLEASKLYAAKKISGEQYQQIILALLNQPASGSQPPNAHPFTLPIAPQKIPIPNQ